MCDIVFVGQDLTGSALKDWDRRVKAADIELGSYEVRSFPVVSPLSANVERKFLAGHKANLIVPLGEAALQMVVGETGIRDYRGSILSSVIGGKPRKVVPTYHPREIWNWWVPSDITSKFDLERIREQGKFPEVRRKQRRIVVPKNKEQVLRWGDTLRRKPKLSVDIECTMQSHNLICVGFASSDQRAVVLGAQPHMFEDGIEGCEASTQLIRELCGSPIPKVLQNGNFDITFLKRKGFPFKGFYFDTLYAHHLLQVELPRSLAYLASIYTDQPYFKGMVNHAKSEGQMNWGVMARYNGLDCCVTYEVGEELERQVREAGLWEFFQRHYIRLLEPLMEAQLEGVRVDVQAKDKLKEELLEDLSSLDIELDGFMPDGWMPSKEEKRRQSYLDNLLAMVKKGQHRKKDGTIAVRYSRWCERYRNFVPEINYGSPQQVAEMLYGTLRIPKRTKDGKVTTDDTALQKIIRSNVTSETGRLFCGKLLERRALVKLIGTYLECPLDDDERMRCTYNVARTKTGRLSSERNIFGTGTNLQNIPKRKGRGGAVRALFLPDEGDVFVAADYGQAEARVVGYAAGEKGFIDCFRSGRDLFKVVASRCFGTDYESILEQQRDDVKPIVHGKNYGMAPNSVAFRMGKPFEEALPIIQAYDQEFYRITDWHHETRDQIDLTRRLTTPFGRYRIFYDRVKTLVRNKDRTLATSWNNNYLRDAYSYYPQSTVGDLLNESLLNAWDLVHERKWKVHRPHFRLQIHDEQVWSVHPDDVDQFKEVLKEAMDIPLTINGETFTIPTKQSVGPDWASLK